MNPADMPVLAGLMAYGWRERRVHDAVLGGKTQKKVQPKRAFGNSSI